MNRTYQAAKFSLILVVFAVAAFGSFWAAAQSRSSDPAPRDSPAFGPFHSGPYTLRILGAQWSNIDAWQPGLHGFPPVFDLHYAVEGPGVSNTWGSLNTVDVTAEDQWGRNIQPRQTARVPTDVGWTEDDHLVDPRLGQIHLDFKVRGRPDWVSNAEENQDVTFSPVALDALGPELGPWPGPPATFVAVDGIRLSLVAGSRTPAINGSGRQELTLAGRWLPPESDPSLDVEINPNDETSSPAPRIFFEHSGQPMPGVSLDSFLDGRFGDEERNGYFTWKCRIPEGADAATPSVRIRDCGDDTDVLATFHLTLPIPVPPSKPSTAPHALYVCPLDAGRVILEPERFFSGSGDGCQFESQLIFDMPDSQIQGLTWSAFESTCLVTGSALREPGVAPDYADAPFRVGGPPLTPNQAVSKIDSTIPYFPWPDPKLDYVDKNLNISVTCRQVRKTLFHLNFSSLPIPAPGRVSPANVAVQAGNYGQFIVRKVGWFTEEQPLSAIVAKKSAQMQPPYGLAVVIEHVPNRPEPTFKWGDGESWSLTTGKSVDVTGRELNLDQRVPNDPPEDSEIDDLAGPGRPLRGYFATFYFLPPATGSHTFDMELDAFRKELLPPQLVTFKNVLVSEYYRYDARNQDDVMPLHESK